MEVVSLIGNVTIKEGAPFTHIHVTLGRRDLSIVGGHFNDAIVHPTLEIWLSSEAEPVHRALDEACGLFVMQLPGGRSIPSVVTVGNVAPTGRILQINVSGGGVPKMPVDQAWVGRFGLRGDAHDEFTVHGGPHQAVCLFGIEAIERLQSEGHPVEPGSVGENLTTTGVEWSTLPVGTRARIGDTLEIELASPAMPCKTQVGNFIDGRFSRMSIDLHPSDSRMYARVLTEGEVRQGDPITVLPPAPDSRALDELVLYRLDRAEAKSSTASWRAARESGFEIEIVEDGDIAMACAPAIGGPAFNNASGLACYRIWCMATGFDRRIAPGWLWMDEPPWPGAQAEALVAVFAADPNAVEQADLVDGLSGRLIGPRGRGWLTSASVYGRRDAGRPQRPRSPIRGRPSTTSLPGGRTVSCSWPSSTASRSAPPHCTFIAEPAGCAARS